MSSRDSGLMSFQMHCDSMTSFSSLMMEEMFLLNTTKARDRISTGV